MNRLFALFLLVAGIYFANQYFTSESYEGVGGGSSSENHYTYSNEPSRPIPVNCKKLFSDLETTLYGIRSGQVSLGQRKPAYRELKSCLRSEGFSASQINKTIIKLEKQVEERLHQDELG